MRNFGTIFLVCLCFETYLFQSLFIAKKLNSNYYFCVTNSSFALSAISKNYFEKINSYYVPKTKSSTQIFKIAHNYRVTYQYYPWKIHRNEQNGIILDERWEDFPLRKINNNIRLPFINNKYYSTLYIDNVNNFEIPFSIRIEKEAHIFLCESEEPVRSRNCYWFILDSYYQKVSKCDKKHYNSDGSDASGINCTTKWGTSKDLNFLSSDKWSHFLLSKQQNRFVVELWYSYNNSRVILDWSDIYNQFLNTNYFFVLSEYKDGLWKLHELTYIQTNEESTDVKLGSGFTPENSFACVSMYIKMCILCSITLKLQMDQTILNEKTYKDSSNWKQIKIFANVVSTQKVDLYVTTSGSSTDKYWKIDHVRICQKEEFRVIKMSENYPCQLMSGEDNRVKLSVNRPPTSTSGCAVNAIGPFCAPCDLFFKNDCDRVTICTNSFCECSAGFYDSDCQLSCAGRTYGQGCEMTCGKCAYTYCDNVNGKCLDRGCEGNYTGERCDIRLPRISYVVTSYTTTAVITIPVQSPEINSKYSYSRLQYKQQVQSNFTWVFADVNIKFGQQTNISLKNLEPKRRYVVRVAFIPPNNAITDILYIDAKEASFTTLCADVTEQSITIIPKETGADITIKLSQYSCKLDGYDVSIRNNKKQDCKKLSVINKSFSVNGLEPSKKYFFCLKKGTYKVGIPFHTIQKIPYKVTGLMIFNVTSTSVNIKWKLSSILKNNFNHYKVSYRRLYSLGCNMKEQLNGASVYQTDTIIENLSPFSKYQFNVSVANITFVGTPQMVYFQTLSSNKITEKEFPTVNIEEHSNCVRIKFNLAKCEERQGPISFNVTYYCKDVWCAQKKTSTYSTKKTIDLQQLIPFSQYEFVFQFCRNESMCNKTKISMNAKTKAAAPLAVTELDFFSKTNESVFLRWIPPYPPYGELDQYIIQANDTIHNVNQTYLRRPEKCPLWPDYNCAVIGNLSFKTKYTIMVKAQNKNLTNQYGTPQTLKVFTGIEPPGSPENLTLFWDTGNGLNITWQHPNRSNGNIYTFNIKLTSLNSRRTKKNSEIFEQFSLNNAFKLFYSIKIPNSKLLPSTPYNVTITANNSLEGKPAWKRDTSPPEVPVLLNTTISSKTNSSISIEYNFQAPVNKNSDYKLDVYIINNNSRDNCSLLYNCSIDPLKKFLLIIGTNEQQNGCYSRNPNPIIINSTQAYNFRIDIISLFKNKSSRKTYYISYKTDSNVSNSSWLALLVLLLIIPIVVFGIKKRNKFSACHIFAAKAGESLEEQELSLVQSCTKLTTVCAADILSTSSPQPVVELPIYSKAIAVNAFEDYVKTSVANGELERQFDLFPSGQTEPCVCGSSKINKSKNRYHNVIAYDHTRVVLEKIESDENSDYINANYIDGYETPKAYIATQGPLEKTLVDFWRMIWQENVRVVAILANIIESGKEKVKQYWPNINETLVFGEISVQYISSVVFVDYECRIFKITYKNEWRRLEQLHFLSWPDHNIPPHSQSFISFLKKMLNVSLNSNSPVVVHCSAGIGRTGTFILCDICLRMAAKEEVLDPLKVLQKMRSQRPRMVDNIQQYKLAHLVILEYLVGMNTVIPCNNIEKSVKRLLNEGVEQQMLYVQETQWQNHAMRSFKEKEEEALIVTEKNRFQHIIPEIRARVFISIYPVNDATSSYINAIKVDRLRSPGGYIVTQQPLPNTLGDFWRMVNENNVSVIISLNEVNIKDPTSCIFWPTKSSKKMIPVDIITLTYVDSTFSDYYSLVRLKLKNKKTLKKISIISPKNWEPQDICPKDVHQFLSFWQKADAISRYSKTIVITCYNGVTASGLYLAMCCLIEKMNLEQTCNVCQVIRILRYNRPEFIKEKEQFEFLYKTAVAYIMEFENYSNFN